MELAELKATVEQVREKYVFSERRAYRLMTLAVTPYRYSSQRTDEPLRTKLVELAREKPRFGYRRLHGDGLRQRSGVDELTSRHFLAWCVERQIELLHIQPGQPAQNARIESFHGRLREECLVRKTLLIKQQRWRAWKDGRATIPR